VDVHAWSASCSLAFPGCAAVIGAAADPGDMDAR